jgi:hypothetical protein
MTLQRMDNVLIVVDDLEGAKAFAEPRNAPANTLGIRRIYRLCFIRGPEGIILGLAEELG